MHASPMVTAALALTASLVAACGGAQRAPSSEPAGSTGAPATPGETTGAAPGEPQQQTPPPPAGAPPEGGGTADDPAPVGCGKAGPSRKYVGKSADECARIRFACEPGFSYFSDDCGCGCAMQP